MEDYLIKLRESEQEMIESLKDIISVPSVAAPPLRTAEGEILPFGRCVHDALLRALRLGESMGFETGNVDNYGGHIIFRSENSEGVFGISGHLDVMPAGNGWNTDPWELVVKDGYMYGRGTSDDKGPLYASLYAMKAIKDAGLKPKMDIKLILGLDEETGKSGMVKYLEKEGHPDMGFTPDGQFPLVNGEMGIILFDLCQKYAKSQNKEGLRLTKMTGGTAPNVAAGDARAVVASTDKSDYEKIMELADAYASETGYSLKCRKQGTSLAIEAAGIACHGAYPEEGLNAISIMMDFLGRLTFVSEDLNDFIAFYNEHIGFNVYGENIGCGFSDEPSGRLKFNVGMAEFNEEISSLTVNVRIPVSYDSSQVYAGMEQVLEGTSIGIVKGEDQGSVYFDMDTPMVKNMLEAYYAVTGDTESESIVSPGGTYAKVVNNTMAFGPQFPGEEDTMHQPNERLSIESFRKMAEIYARAIVNCCC